MPVFGLHLNKPASFLMHLVKNYKKNEAGREQSGEGSIKEPKNGQNERCRQLEQVELVAVRLIATILLNFSALRL